MRSRSKLIETIEDSEPAEWDELENPSTWVLWDEELTITDIGHNGTGEAKSVRAPEFLQETETDEHMQSTIRISYRGTPFDQYPVLRLDGDHIRLVKPRINQSTGEAFLNAYETHLSQIIGLEDLDELRRDILKLTISEGS